MLAAPQTLYQGFEVFRVAGYALNYDTFLGPNLASNFAALGTTSTETCGSSFDGDLLVIP